MQIELLGVLIVVIHKTKDENMRRHTTLNLLIVFIFFTPVAISYSNESNQIVSLENSLFAPALTENNHGVCSDIFADAQNHFLSENSSYEHYFSRSAEIAGMQSVDLHRNNLGVSLEEVTIKHKRTGQKYTVKKPFVILNGNKFYLHHHTAVPGCGGACEQYQLLISKNHTPENLDELEKKSPPPSRGYQLFQASNNSYWLYHLDREDNLHAYQLEDSGAWVKACQINLHPSSLYEPNDIITQKANDALMELKTTVFGLTRGAGSCGSSNTHYRWKNKFLKILPSVLYRPWALQENSGLRYRDTHGTYGSDLVGLKDWSLMGISEYHSFQDYLLEIENTINEVAIYYQNKFGWSATEAKKIAETAITSAVSTAIRFYRYDPIASYSERNLRKAILEKKPIDQIQNIPIATSSNYHTRNESLLSLAVEYPAALKLLLESGIDPNHENEFGKTPLMYAAQYNQYESVKYLLEYGANPNAQTTKPNDTCFYTIQTFSMTPLHYSVRYASPEIIKLILEYGAASFITAENKRKYPYKKETPLDWLKRYTQKDFEEKNPNIDDSQIATIGAWLTIGDEKSLSQKARKLIITAESQYQQSKISEAYRSISLALSIQPDNERALSDMSLIALKNGKLGQSVEASDKLIKQSSSNKIKANALFNQGLACEEHRNNNSSYFLPYNGKYYCRYGSLDLFYKAVKNNPTTARKNKILEIFSIPQGNYCELSSKGIKINFQTGRPYNPKTKRNSQLQTLFVLHRSDINLSGGDFAWSIISNDKSPKEIVPEKVDSISLGEYTLSLFTTYNYSTFPYDILDHRCTSKTSTAQEVSK